MLRWKTRCGISETKNRHSARAPPYGYPSDRWFGSFPAPGCGIQYLQKTEAVREKWTCKTENTAKGRGVVGSEEGGAKVS